MLLKLASGDIINPKKWVAIDRPNGKLIVSVTKGGTPVSYPWCDQDCIDTDSIGVAKWELECGVAINPSRFIALENHQIVVDVVHAGAPLAYPITAKDREEILKFLVSPKQVQDLVLDRLSSPSAEETLGVLTLASPVEETLDVGKPSLTPSRPQKPTPKR